MSRDPTQTTHLKVLGDATLPRPAQASRVALISLTTFCNAACPFCCVLDILNKPELNPTDEKILERMAEARAEGCTILGFTGGEPTVHPRFAEFCKRGRELGYESITINTNGIQFKSRAWTEAALAAGLSHIDFSIHGDDDAMHDAMMARPGAFAAFRRGMAHLRELGPKYRPVLGATTVVTATNAARLPAIAAMLVDEGIQTLRFKHCFEGAEGADVALVARYADLMGYVREAVRVARSRGAMVTLTHFPLCLLGDEAVFATDLTEEAVLSINRDGEVLLDGRASDHRRGAASVCEGCALAAVCTKLDQRYVAVHGESELHPIAGRVALQDFLERGLERHPGEPMAGHVRRLLGAPPAAAPDSRPPLLVSGSDSMNIGFISPTFRVLEMNWEHDYEMVKLGIPTVMGHLYRLGHRDLEHWDFDAQICEACAVDANAFDLRQYFDQGLVTGFLQGTDDTLRAQTEKLLDVLGVTEKAIFGISLSAVLDRIVNVMALAAVGQCIAKVLRERYPKSSIVVGGLQASPDSTQPAIYQRIMEECPAIDYAHVGHVEVVTIQLFRNLWNGKHDLNRTLGSRVLYRDTDGAVRFSGWSSEEQQKQHMGSDLLTLSGLRKGVPVHTNIGANAIAAAGGVAAEASDPAVIAAHELMRSKTVLEGAKHVPAPVNSKASDFERTDLSAAEAGAHAYDTIPAAVPVFDPKLVERFRYSGRQIMKRFHFDKEAALKYSRFENDQIVVLPHIFIRGCNAPCGFCSYAYTKIEGEDLAQTVAGLRFLSETYNCKHFHFLNTQINSVYKYAEMFCDALIDQRLDILWSDCCNMRSLDEHLLEKMRKAGAMRLVFGVESPEDSMLRMINKGMNTETIERLLKASNDLGIWNHVLLIAGMPHETKAKQDRIMEFLEKTAPTVDFYSVSSYYLIATSPWGKNPEKFGIERITDPNGYLEDQSFNETPGGKWESDGLRWPEKRQQIIDSTQRFYKTITRAKGQSRCVAGNIDLYLLMFLYSALGHDRKEEISKLYLQTAKTIFPGQGPDAEKGDEPLARNRFRVEIPYILGRVNEADQFSQVNIPVDFDVLPLSSGQRGFVNTARYTFTWRSPALQTITDEGTKQTRKGLADNLPQLVAQLTRMLGPFLQALDGRLAPSTPERMAELAAINLPRYKPFANEGYTVQGPATQRTIMERNLEWSGLGG